MSHVTDPGALSSLPRVDELLAQLQTDDDGSFVYRGQSRHYGVLLPSRYRSIAEREPNERGLHWVQRSRLIAEHTRRMTQQVHLRNYLVKQFGMPVGNLMCQQYTVLSDVIDVSESLKVAAFFATRRWPPCSHIPSSDTAGVIYRWPKFDPAPRGLRELRRWASVGELDAAVDRADVPLIPARFRWAEPGSADAVLVRDAHNGEFYLRPDILTFPEAFTVLQSAHAQSGHGSGVQDALGSFESTRWFAQRGGLLRVFMAYPAFWSMPEDARQDDPQIDPETNAEIFMAMDVVIDEPFGIGDALKLQGVEAFFFRHTTIEIDLDPKAIWPSTEEDSLFRALSLLTWVSSASYLDETRANTPWDRYAGLLDRGFYSEVNTEAESRRQHAEFQRLLPP